MSIIRAPYQSKRYKGGLDSLVAYHLLDKYFEEGQRILDPMAGSRTVEKEGERLGIYVLSNDLKDPGGWDARLAWPFPEAEFHGVFMHPPYFGAKQYLTKDEYTVTKLSSEEDEAYVAGDPRDLGRIKDYWEYIMNLKWLMAEAKRVVIPGGYIVLIIGDHRKSNRIRLVHSDIYYLSTMELGLPLENYDLWEISATGTPLVWTKHMMMLNWCMAFKVPPKPLEEFT